VAVCAKSHTFSYLFFNASNRKPALNHICHGAVFFVGVCVVELDDCRMTLSALTAPYCTFVLPEPFFNRFSVIEAFIFSQIYLVLTRGLKHYETIKYI
jgi:hypothetical protein